MNSLALSSPSKINLFLKVLHKRNDGFHEIDTLFERIDLADTIRLKKRRDGKVVVRSSDPNLPIGPKNLVTRVAQLLQSQFDVAWGADIHITKRIPIAAGLGGGSSNAATVLQGLNQLWNLRLDQKILAKIGAQIGSDVPFFLYGRSWARGRGRGERITPLKIRRKLWHILVVPRVKVYSSAVYGALNYQLTKNKLNVNILLSSIEKNNISKLCESVHNDLEHAVLKFAPGLKVLKERLNSLGAQGVTISGSGPSVFGFATSEAHAKQLKGVLAKKYSRVFVVKTL